MVCCHGRLSFLSASCSSEPIYATAVRSSRWVKIHLVRFFLLKTVVYFFRFLLFTVYFSLYTFYFFLAANRRRPGNSKTKKVEAKIGLSDRFVFYSVRAGHPLPLPLPPTPVEQEGRRVHRANPFGPRPSFGIALRNAGLSLEILCFSDLGLLGFASRGHEFFSLFFFCIFNVFLNIPRTRSLLLTADHSATSRAQCFHRLITLRHQQRQR